MGPTKWNNMYNRWKNSKENKNLVTLIMRKFKSIRVICVFKKKSGKASDSTNLCINLNHTVNHRVLLQCQNMCTSFVLLYCDRNICTANYFKDRLKCYMFSLLTLERNIKCTLPLSYKSPWSYATFFALSRIFCVAFPFHYIRVYFTAINMYKWITDCTCFVTTQQLTPTFKYNWS
jgi:hypothetical protein